MYKQVITHTSGHHSRIMIADRLNQYFLCCSFMNRTYFSCDGLNFMKKAVKSLFHNICRYLVFHFCGRCSGTFGINKRKCAVIADFSYNVQRLFKIFFCLPRESDDNICGKRNIRHFRTQFFYQFQIRFFRIMTVHFL